MSRNKGLTSIHNLPPTEANKRKEKVSGSPSHCPPDSVPQTPSGELRPLHPLLLSGYQTTEVNKRKEKVSGAPQTPSGELRPLHPLLLSGCQTTEANKRKEKVSGGTPDPVRGASPPAPPLA